MKTMTFIIVSLCLSACVKVKDAQKDEPSEAHFEVAQGNLLVQKPQVQELEEPHHYKVVIPGLQNAQALRRKIKGTTNPFQTLAVPPEADSFVDDQVVEGQTYIYEAGNIDNDQFSVRDSFEVTVPQDLEVQNEIILQKDEVWTQYRRIFFSPGGVVTTQGHQLVIQADQLLNRSPNSGGTPGIFRTFAPGATGGLGTIGRSGGLIQILLRTGQGAFQVELRGENGGDGRDGQIAKAGLINGQIKGDDGQNGQAGGSTGRAEITIQEKHNLVVQHTMSFGIGGKGGKGTDRMLPTNPFTGIDVPPGANGVLGANGSTETFCLSDYQNPTCK